MLLRCLFFVLLALPFSAFAEDPKDTAADTGTLIPAPPASVIPSPAPTPAADKPWFRSPADYLAFRSKRLLAPTETSTKIITDAKRFDVSLGVRLPVYSWYEEGQTDGWSIGVDGGILSSLIRYTSQGRFTFATNTFDGMFGAWIGFVNGNGWLAMFRTAHLSAHLVDNSPLIGAPVAYSQFWNEVIVGKTFPETRRVSDWNLHLQGSIGLNHTAIPQSNQPRADLSAEYGHALYGPDSLAALAIADANRPGVLNQPNTYFFFAGLGYLSRPDTTHRPLRFGVAYFRGSDYRNQLYFNRQNWFTFEVAGDF